MNGIEREVSYNQVVLVTFSKTHGPRVPVRRMRKIEVRDAGSRDVIRLHVDEHDLAHAPEPMTLKGSGIKHFLLPRGSVRVERVAGDNPITVLAHCERFVAQDGTRAPE